MAPTGAMSVPIKLWDEQSLLTAKRDETFLLGAYFGLLGVMVLYNLILILIVLAAIGLFSLLVGSSTKAERRADANVTIIR